MIDHDYYYFNAYALNQVIVRLICIIVLIGIAHPYKRTPKRAVGKRAPRIPRSRRRISPWWNWCVSLSRFSSSASFMFKWMHWSVYQINLFLYHVLCLIPNCLQVFPCFFFFFFPFFHSTFHLYTCSDSFFSGELRQMEGVRVWHRDELVKTVGSSTPAALQEFVVADLRCVIEGLVKVYTVLSQTRISFEQLIHLLLFTSLYNNC